MLAFVVHPEVKEELERLQRRKERDTKHVNWEKINKVDSEQRDKHSKEDTGLMDRFVDQEVEDGKKRIKIHQAELQDIFAFLELDPHTGRISPRRLKEKLEPLFGSQGLSDYDVECMMLQQHKLSFSKLMELLMDNDLDDEEDRFNPIENALSLMFDRRKTGFINPVQLMEMFEKMGYGTITKSDIINVMQQCDVNNDGKLSIEECCSMIFEYDLKNKCGLTEEEIASLDLQ